MTAVGADDTVRKLASAAFVAVTLHVPALVLDRVNGVAALTAQPVAVPLATV